MSYPGNPSLSAAVQDRVVSTFQQTLTLFQQGGRMDEVAAGCTLLLQMDPMFDPAKRLMEKLRNPGLPMDVASLMPASDPRSPMEQARVAMTDRDFQRVIQITSDVLTEDLLNDEARILGDDAREKLEAAPFVEQFARKASLSLEAGNVASAKMELEKARALDPIHPEVLRVAKSISARDAAPATAGLPPSFIVDDARPAPTGGRPAAQAADFGFTFEEEKPTNVSFDQFSFDSATAPSDFSFQPPPAPPKDDTPFGGFSFDAAPAPPAPTRDHQAILPGGDFDFSSASVLTTDDDQKKISQFLADGDQAARSGDYSQAIDLWSRIFLIDVTNDAASERIETAKARRREIEQKVEPILTAGVDAFERGDMAAARASLSQVLAADPRNSVAQDYLDRAGAANESVPFSPSRPYSAPGKGPVTGDIFDEELPPGLEIPLVPPDPLDPAASTAKPQKAKPAKQSQPSRPLPLRLIALVAGVLVLLAGGYFAWTRFANQPEPVETTVNDGQALMGRATVLAGKGKFDQAIALLQDIKPGDPQHERALLMIADLRGKKSTSAQLIDGVPAEEFYAQRVEAARVAFTANDFTGAKSAFEEAMRVKPLTPELKTQYETSAQQASKLDAAKALFAERKYSEVIANLEPLRLQEPQNVSIQRMIADAHFNLGATALQEEKVPDAIREFDEVLKVNPADELARRSRELATRYNGESKDLLYKIYVKYLPLRQGT